MLSKTAKQQVVDDIASRFNSDISVFVVEYKGLKVSEMEELRRKLRQTNTQLRVVKNTLLERASEGTAVGKMKNLFSGPTAVGICDGESSAAAKVFVEYGKDHPEIFKIKGGLFEGELIDVGKIERISNLPAREYLISEFVGLLSASMSGLAGVLEHVRSQIVYVLEDVKNKKEE